MTDVVITRIPRPKVHASELCGFEKKSRYRNADRDQFLRENSFLHSAILAMELKRSESFVQMLQRRAGLRKFSHHRRASKY